MFESPSLAVILFASAVGGRRWVGPMVAGFIGAALVNLPWFARNDTHIPESLAPLIEHLAQPWFMIAGSVASGLLILVGIVRLFTSGSPEARMASTLERRGDHRGAAEIHERIGNLSRAIKLYRRARCWGEAARASRSAGNSRAAAELYRRAGGRALGEAATLYRAIEMPAEATECERALAEWLAGQGFLTEAIEAWLRAGDPIRAARAAAVAVSENKLQPNHPSFSAARRAALESHNYSLQAQLSEAEGNWSAAGQAWMKADDPKRAAAAFSRSSRLEDAARAELAAGRPERAARLRLQAVEKMADSLRQFEGRNAPESEQAGVRRRIEIEAERLIPLLGSLGMREEMIRLLRTTGRYEEAVDRLIASGQDAEAVELARDAQRWDLAAPILERMRWWDEASDVYELAGNLEAAARTSELAGDDARALELYRSLGKPLETARCLARVGRLPEGLTLLHRTGLLTEARELLRAHPGPIPDIPDVVLDMAADARESGQPEEAVACLQRAVLGVALNPQRVGPAVALARQLLDLGDDEAALEHVNRVLQFDYSNQAALDLKAAVAAVRSPARASETRPDFEAFAAPVSRASRGERRYEIRHELGRGGMGVVYLARDTRLVRDVAIKVLRTTSREEASHLEREAQAAATLNHPGIVTVYDFEEGFDGYFIAMEYVNGRPLDEILKQDRARVLNDLRPILRSIASALAYAHDHHVIHRDIKPGNVLLTDDNRVKILDFGIAARMDTGDGAHAGVCGTPYYMAPEQIRGESPTPATDVYGFGAMAFHLATGHPPFPKGNVIEAHLETPAPDPSEDSPGLPGALAQLILQCLEKQPEHRPATGRAVLEALSRTDAVS